MNDIKNPFLIVFLLIFTMQPATFIFDLDGVLITQKSTLSKFWNIGPLNLLGLFNPIKLDKYFFELLSSISPLHTVPPIHYQGKPIPHIMVEWQAGHHTCQTMIERISDALHQKPFRHKKSRKALQAIANFLFTPHRFGRSFKVVPEGISLLEKAINAAHTLCLLTNFDKETFAYLKDHSPLGYIFEYFDYIIVSGEIQLVKPDPAIFHYCFNHCNIDPDTEPTFYFDDSLENITSAKKLNKKNLFCFYFSPKKYTHILKELRLLQAL